MKRKEKEAYWSAKIDEYQSSGLALSEWCDTAEVAVHNMKYWLRKQSPVNPATHQETSWVSCVVEESIEDSISLKVNHVDIEVTSGYDETLLLQVIRTLRQI
ncbi:MULTISPECIES: IS66 family insertion sequence element accessory protein TnpA [Bacillales]|uniref:Transposase n=3 Tax=Sporosarcina ureae TaxID=1571 RepID=A0ABM6JS44_SPOUR|nr:hypothetical protein [Sporosarcina ureae]ARF13010.1 hypothetical protein SporoS204_01750 [Sporosarcina ureae]ARF13989.1 hypothetical protein SporoS204_07425 [Sporosarcina ureae]ARF14014.1 hypothetical protein SporoS204_07555 [Sporosarcina ureae]ARF14681.1 hypothetical protein SporoS204_11320 [Sporosarcina ureae]